MSVHLYAVKERKVCHVQSAISLIVCAGQVILVLYYLGASNVTEVYAYVDPSQDQHLLDHQEKDMIKLFLNVTIN